jgi:hypothetical protein
MELMVAPSAESIIQHFSENASLARGFGQWLLISALHLDKIDKKILRFREAIGCHDQGAVEEAAKAWVGKNTRHPPHGTSFPGTSLRLYKASKDEIYGDHSCAVFCGREWVWA